MCVCVFRALPDHIQLDVDGDRETERIYSLFSCYMSKLLKMQEACGSSCVYDGPEQQDSGLLISAPQETFQTLRQLLAAVQTLQQLHARYSRQRSTTARIGSQEHPIGDQSFQSSVGQQSESSSYSI